MDAETIVLASLAVIVVVAAGFFRHQVTVNRLGGRIAHRLRNDEASQMRSYEFEFAARVIHSGDVKKLRAFDEHMSEYGLNIIDCTVDALRASGRGNLSKRLTSAELGAVKTLLMGSYAMGTPEASQWDDLLRHVVLHPADAEEMAQAVRRGIFDIDQVIDMAKTFKDNPAPALSEGAL